MRRPAEVHNRRERLRTLSWLLGEFDRLFARGELVEAQKVLYQLADRLDGMMAGRSLAPHESGCFPSGTFPELAEEPAERDDEPPDST